MQKILLTIGLLICFSCYGQQTERVVIAKEDPYNLYASNGKDSATLFYEKIIPKGKPAGVLVILPGGGETIEEVKQQISLHTLAVQKNLLVLIPCLNWGTTRREPEHQFLDAMFRQVMEAHQVPKEKVVMGGFSNGGMIALTYAQKAQRERGSTLITPRAVFGVDPPLDYAHLWNHCVKDIERNVSEVAVAEGKWIIENYTKDFGGSPEAFRENYVKYSIYSYSEKDGGNAKYLTRTPVLLYTEPDIMWQMENRSRDYYDLNCVDIAAMINYLKLNGNKDAQLVVTSNKGRRLNGKQHPHSWSIMDSQQCLSWILKQLEK